MSATSFTHCKTDSNLVRCCLNVSVKIFFRVVLGTNVMTFSTGS